MPPLKVGLGLSNDDAELPGKGTVCVLCEGYIHGRGEEDK